MAKIVQLENLVGHHAAIYRQARARDPTRAGRGQEETGIGHIFGQAEAMERRGLLPARHAIRPSLIKPFPPD